LLTNLRKGLGRSTQTLRLVEPIKTHYVWMGLGQSTQTHPHMMGLDRLNLPTLWGWVWPGSPTTSIMVWVARPKPIPRVFVLLLMSLNSSCANKVWVARPKPIPKVCVLSLMSHIPSCANKVWVARPKPIPTVWVLSNMCYV
jgi:hypothetical protein